MTPDVLSASTMTGDPVVNLEGERLGTVKELMIDLPTGLVAYAVLARGGISGMGEKLFAVPWQLFTVDGDNKRLVLDLSEEAVEDSPGFDPDSWPTLSDIGWHEGIHRHYDVEPFWE